MKALLKRALSDTHPLRLLYHRLKNQLIAFWMQYPAKNLTVIAITGTDGKTTTVAMTAHILQSAGKKVGGVSTAFFEIDGVREPNPTQKTSVDATTLQMFLRRLVREGCTHAVIEASSHGLMQGRLAGITPTVAAVTNVTMEHLDYHGTMAEYVAAKGLLFAALAGSGTKVLNRDDPSFEPYGRIPSKQTMTYSPKRQLSDIRDDVSSVSATMNLDGKSIPLTLPMPGAFNLENALCAIVCAEALGISPEKAAEALRTFKGAGGRMESIACGQAFHVFIDFTVTPAAYERTLTSTRAIAAGHRLLVLTGSCGDRMREKRPIVGRLCAEMADVTVITNEDPYTEDPERIIDDVLSGVPETVPVFRSTREAGEKSQGLNKYCVRLSDRLEAIQYLLKLAKEGDVVLLCGKGADITMMTKSGQVPWNEKEIVKEELQKLEDVRHKL